MGRRKKLSDKQMEQSKKLASIRWKKPDHSEDSPEEPIPESPPENAHTGSTPRPPDEPCHGSPGRPPDEPCQDTLAYEEHCRGPPPPDEVPHDLPPPPRPDEVPQGDLPDAEYRLICPVCRKDDSDNQPWIGCDLCDTWYHWLCVGIIREPPENQSWYCPRCRPENQVSTL